jgi:hypothetical protein
MCGSWGQAFGYRARSRIETCRDRAAVTLAKVITTKLRSTDGRR